MKMSYRFLLAEGSKGEIPEEDDNDNATHKSSLTVPSAAMTSLLYHPSEKTLNLLPEFQHIVKKDHGVIDGIGWTPLMVAVAGGSDGDVIERLLKKYPDHLKTHRNILDLTAEDIAVFTHHQDAVFHLGAVQDLEEEEDEVDDDGDVTDAFLAAASAGDVKTLQDLYLSGHKVRADDVGPRAIINAAKGGHCEAIALLLDWGVHPDVRDLNLWTPLQYARQFNHAGAEELLIRRGADPELLPRTTRGPQARTFSC